MGTFSSNIFTMIMASLVFLLAASETKFIIGGAGPVGYYVAYKLYKNYGQDVSIHMVDPRGDRQGRGQVIRIPYPVARDLDPEIRKALWPEEEIRDMQSVSKDSEPYGPKFLNGWPFIQISNFQKVMLEYLVERLGKNFTPYFDKTMSIAKDEQLRAFLKNEEDFVFFCTCGKISEYLREKQPDYSQDSKYLGMYMLGNIDKKFINKSWDPAKMKEDGITFAISNNTDNAYQLYMYNEAKAFKNLFELVPDLKNFEYSSQKREIETLNDAKNDESHAKWAEGMIEYIENISKKHGIPIDNFKHDKIYWAPRGEYYWTKVFDEDKNTIYFGDSAGGTDWRLGLSLGRGLKAIQDIFAQNDIKNSKRKRVSPFKNNKKRKQNANKDWKSFGQKYQEYWNNVMATEFRQQDNYNSNEWTKLVYEKYFAVTSQ